MNTTSFNSRRLARPLAPHLAALAPMAAAVAAAVALLLGGCASPGPDVAPLERIAPAALGLATPAQPAAPTGWEALGDPRLNALIEQALQGQPSLAAAQARVARAAALAQVAGAVTSVQAQLGVDLSRQHYSANGLIPAPIAGNIWSSGTVQAGASWAPDFFGLHAAELQAALGQARAAQADAAAAGLALSAQVAHAYVGLARLLAQRPLVERQLAQRTELQSLTRLRVAAGLDTRVEQVQADGPLPEARGQLEALDEQISLLRHQLALLCGQGPQAMDQLSPSLAAMRTAELPQSIGADLLGRRPEVVAARWRVEASVSDVAAARSQFYPDINLTAFVGLNALGLNRLFEADSRQYGVAPALRLPILEGGRLRAQLKGQQAGLDAAVAQYNGLVLDAVREAADAISSVQSLARQAREQAAALASAEAGYALAQQRGRAGLGNGLNVLAAETPLLAQRRQMAELQARQLDAQVFLIKALGGGWADAGATVATAAAAH